MDVTALMPTATAIDGIVVPTGPTDRRTPATGDRRRQPRLEHRVWVATTLARWLIVVAGAATLLGSHHDGRAAIALLLLAATATALAADHRLRRIEPTTAHAALVELVVAAAAIGISGGLSSPFVLAPAVPLMLAGYAFTDNRVIALGGMTIVATALLPGQDGHLLGAPRTLALVAVVDVMSGTLGIITRNIVEALARSRQFEVDRLAHLTEANAHLVALHGLACTMPASLDLGEVLAAFTERIDPEFAPTFLCCFVRNDATGHWTPELARGVRAATSVRTEELPYGLRQALFTDHTVLVDDALRRPGTSLASMARSGLYVALRSRDEVVGILAVEHEQAARYGSGDRASLDLLAVELGLHVDNARWFSRLRTIGAETERARIARDLHDRIAQSVAYASFELERLVASPQQATVETLTDLHGVVRGISLELRDTLFDLRATVNESDDIVTVARRFAQHLNERYGTDIQVRARVDSRLPRALEMELWRIVQEALQNFVRHADTRRATLTIDVGARRVRIELVDNGRGFTPRLVGSGHFGLVGMRERAEAIGADLAIDSEPDRGTSIRIDLEVPQ